MAESTSAPGPEPVTLSPGDIASADIRWGGELARAESEWIDTLYVQLAQQQAPLPVHIGERALIDDPDEPPPDISIFTTVRIQPFEPVDQAWLSAVRGAGCGTRGGVTALKLAGGLVDRALAAVMARSIW